jgi:hypothetical protein
VAEEEARGEDDDAKAEEGIHVRQRTCRNQMHSKKAADEVEAED